MLFTIAAVLGHKDVLEQLLAKLDAQAFNEARTKYEKQSSGDGASKDNTLLPFDEYVTLLMSTRCRDGKTLGNTLSPEILTMLEKKGRELSNNPSLHSASQHKNNSSTSTPASTTAADAKEKISSTTGQSPTPTPQNTDMSLESDHLDTLKDENVDLSKEQGVEKALRQLSDYKKGTAVLGALSTSKLGLGIFLNSIPRAKRASEATDLRNLFAAARCLVAGTADAKQIKILEDFLEYVKERGKHQVKRGEVDLKLKLEANDPYGMIKMADESLKAQKKHQEQFVDNLTIEDMAKHLTVANIVMPEGLDRDTITKKSSSSGKRSMMDGNWDHVKGRPITDLKRYVASLLSKPAQSNSYDMFGFNDDTARSRPIIEEENTKAIHQRVHQRNRLW